MECFQRWCELCQDVLPSAVALQQHAQAHHKKNYCQDCNHVYENIRGHRTYEHAGGGDSNSEPTLEQPKVVKRQPARMTRAKTTVAQPQKD